MGSSPVKGSSSTTRSGSWMTAAANCTFCCMPFESATVSFRALAARPTRSSQAWARRPASAWSSPRIAARNVNCSATFILG